MSTLDTAKKAHDTFGKIATISGLLLLPFFGAAAAGYIAGKMAIGAAATNGGVLASFWSPLATDPVTGAAGIGEGISRIFNGWAALGKSGLAVAKAGFDPSMTMADALASPFAG